jgi:hypothetical protein
MAMEKFEGEKYGPFIMAFMERCHPFGGGVQRIYRFPNGYGASVIKTSLSYGGKSNLWELAVVKFVNPVMDGFVLDYDTPITSDVIGWLDDLGVNFNLGLIAKL